MDEDERKAFLIGPGRAAQKGEYADIGRDHGNADGPSGHRAPAQEKMIRGLHPFTQDEAQQKIADDIDDHDRPVKRSELCHLLPLLITLKNICTANSYFYAMLQHLTGIP